MIDIRVEKLNEVHCRIFCEEHIHKELEKYFCFQTPGAQFHPAR